MLSKGFSFLIQAGKGSHGFARAGVLTTPHGMVETPIFMPVGTQASVKAVSPDDLKDLGAEIVLANTYHLYLRPGELKIKKLGGLHSFMNWNRPILTDSGGYQVSSLGHFIEEADNPTLRVKRSVIDEEGVIFSSHLDGSLHRFTPEKSIEIQERLGADIIMAFDEATPERGKQYAGEALRRTNNWLSRSVGEWQRLEAAKGGKIKAQALFGIIQGGNYRDLRRESARFVTKQAVDGVAVGGGSIGRDPKVTEENVSWIRDCLPSQKPLYLMGVGVNPQDVVAAVLSGADLFDCVAPTRLARMGHLYCGELEGFEFVSEYRHGRLNIANAIFELDKKVVQQNCDCYTCRQGFSRAYLHHLFKARELLYYRLATIHNLRLMIRLTKQLRSRIIG